MKNEECLDSFQQAIVQAIRMGKEQCHLEHNYVTYKQIERLIPEITNEQLDFVTNILNEFNIILYESDPANDELSMNPSFGL